MTSVEDSAYRLKPRFFLSRNETACLLVVAAALGSGCLAPAQDVRSSIRSDERVLFFPTGGRVSEDGRTWVVPVHGWIFEPEEDDTLRQVALQRVGDAIGLDRGETMTDIFERRARSFLVDNERFKRISIRVGDRTHTFAGSDRDGHFQGEVQITIDEAARLAPDGRLQFSAITRDGDDRRFDGVAHLISPTGITVISDIDDTIKFTESTDTTNMIRNTFLHEFRAIDGMPKLYQRWAEAGAEFHYVSLSPWQLYEPLVECFHDVGIPEGPFHLRRFRVKDQSLLTLFADALEEKSRVIRPILEAYRKRRFVLVGDSGQKDPEVYGQMARAHPDQVLRIYIRDITGEPADSPRYEEAFRDVPREKWSLFTDPVGLTLPLEQVQER